MAILNVEVQLNVVLLICDVLAKIGPTPKDELIKLCMSGVKKDPNERTKGSINQFNDQGDGAGLFNEDKNMNDTISFADDYKELAECSNQERLEKLPKILRRVIFKNKPKKDFMISNVGTNDINRTFAWLLAQDVYKTSLANKHLFNLERTQFRKGEERVLDDNTSRPRNMREWATFLGFIDQSSDDGVIDPTGVIKETLSDIFGRKGELKANEFVDLLKETLPVLDGGSYRNLVEKSLDTAFWNKPKEGVLSKSLSRALWRLDKDPSVKLILDDRSDAVAVGLDLPRGGTPMSFSHVRRN